MESWWKGNLSGKYQDDIDSGDPNSEAVTETLRLLNLSYSVLKSWVEISQWSDYPTGEPTSEVLQRTLVNDNPDENSTAASDDSFLHWYNIMIQTGDLDITMRVIQRAGAASSIPHQQRERDVILREVMKNDPKRRLVLKGLSGPGFRFHSSIMAFSHKKCFFFTENCHFGTAADPLPVSVEPGDKIAIVGGLDMPLALRTVEGGYRLLTHVYVHGMMHGEAWPENEHNLENIVLL
jgi:hypothetical protein